MLTLSRLAGAVRSSCGSRHNYTLTIALGVLTPLSLCGPAAQAQNAGAQAAGAQQPGAQGAGAQPIEEVTVTGSRLRRTGMETPTPVTTVSSNEINDMAPTVLMDALDQMPQFRDDDRSNTGSIFSSGGSNSVNLRGLGSNRTLTLLDGRRLVEGQQTGTVDIAVIPTALIQRVEVVTGGASAAYGSDAISGVTNFILDTNFTGAKGTVQSGMTSRRDHQNQKVEFAAGSDVGPRGHIIASADFYTSNGVQGYAGRDWGADRWAMVVQGQNPRRFYAKDVCSNTTSTGGVIPSGPLGGTQFVDGQPAPVGTPSMKYGSVQIGGCGSDLSQQYVQLQPDDDRHSVFGYYTRNFGGDKTGYFQVLQGVHDVTSLPAPTGFAPGWSLQLFSDNPYLPQSIVDRMAAANVTSVPFRRVYEQLDPSREVKDTTTSVTAGFKGTLGSDLYLDTYLQRGRNIEYANYSPNHRLVRTDRFYRALDSAIDPATGEIACRANIPAYGGLTPEQEAQVTKINVTNVLVHADPESNRGCIPMDPFATTLPQNLVDYLTGPGIHHHQKLTQDIFDLSLSKNIGGDRRKGPISVGGGVTYRKDSVYQDAFGNPGDDQRVQDLGVFSSYVDPTDQIPIRGMPSFVRDRGVFFTGNPNSYGVLQGEFKVWEAYGEAIVPVLSTGDGGVDLHLAARYADYSGSGGVWAYKLGGDWRINRAVRFRGTQSRDTRAGTLAERFDSQGSGTALGPSYTNQDPLYPNVDYIAGLKSGGNPDVRPELADTTTLGVVFEPQGASGLNVSIDLYDIKIKDAIDTLSITEILDRCYKLNAQDVCALISRNESGTQHLIQQINDVYINIAQTETRGVDLEAAYRKQMNIFGGGDESVAFRFFANYLDEATSNFVGSPPLDQAGELNYPHWLMNAAFTYTKGPFQLNWQTRYRESTIRNVLWTEGVDIADNSVPSRAYTNMTLSYDTTVGKSTGQFYFYVGNLFDKDPPLVPGTVSSLSSYATYTSNVFDELGRSYALGYRFQF